MKNDEKLKTSDSNSTSGVSFIAMKEAGYYASPSNNEPAFGESETHKEDFNRLSVLAGRKRQPVD